MRSLLLFFIVIQGSLAIFMALHDWIKIPPFTDIEALKKHHSASGRFITSVINTSFVLFPLILTWIYSPAMPFNIALTLTVIYGVLTVGTLCAWWIPYLFGSSEAHKAGFAEYKNTHRFLPSRGDNVIPNTLHVILHVQVWMCLVISLYLLLK